MSRHLHVVRDEPPAKRRRVVRPPLLTAEQERAAKASLRGLARSRYGTLVKMAEVLGLHRDSIRQSVSRHRRVSAEILLRAALATGTPVERLIQPGPREVVP